MSHARLTTPLVLLVGLLSCRAGALAQTLEAFKPADTSSPRATLTSFLDSCNEVYRIVKTDHYFDRNSTEHIAPAARILDCLDTSELPEHDRVAKASEAAVCLKEVLDRFELPPLAEIPGEEEAAGSEAAGGPVRWRVPGTRIVIVRIEEGMQRHEYLFSAGTVNRAAQMHHDVKALPYREGGPEVTPGFYEWYMTAPANATVAGVVDWLPGWFRVQTLGVARWKWAGLVASAAVCLLAMAVLYRLHGWAVERWRDKNLFLYGLSVVLPILAAGAPVLFVRFLGKYLSLRGEVFYTASFAGNLLALLTSLVVVFGISNRIAALFIAAPHVNPQGLDAQFIRILSKMLSVGAAAIVLLQGGQYLGIPLATLVASAGIGGLAVALAAQDTLRNLFGTIMLLTDKPFRVGERIVFGKYDGVVEEIGLRSTRLRLLTGHQATIPNDELARNDIENIGRRPHIRRVAEVRLPLETPREQVERVVETIRKLLENKEELDPGKPPRVYFSDFDEESLVVKAMYWFAPPEYWDFMAFGERLNLEVLRAMEGEGIELAKPLRIKQVGEGAEERAS